MSSQTEHPKHPVVHFEMPYTDQDRMVQFYANAFGWRMSQLGAEMDDYVMAETTETGEDQLPISPGSINGGFFPNRPDAPAQYPSIVIQVDDIEAAIESVSASGGEVLGEPMEMPGVGKYVSFIDTEGNRASLLQP